MKSQDRQIGLRNRVALALTIFACSAMAGDILDSLAIKGVGVASTIAPFPKVFCDNQGLEAFASEFAIEAQGAAGSTNIVLTPEIYSRLKGPYNRRNVYGAALAFGPKLPPKLWRSVFAYGVGPSGPLRQELGLPAEATNVVVTITTKTSGRSDRWKLTWP